MLNAMEAIGEGECAEHRLVVRTDCPDTESVRVAVEDSGDIPMAVRAMKVGAVDFLTKPFDVEALFDAVRQALARAS